MTAVNDGARMLRLFPAMLLLVGLWLALSIGMMWPPICRYAGPASVSCVFNLRQIDGAKQQWELESGPTNGPATMSKLIEAGLLTGARQEALLCPSGGTYFCGGPGDPPICSLSTNAIPAPVKQRLGLFYWQWKIAPSRGPHKLPD